MTPDLLRLLLPLAAGAFLGAFFFGGLWWTVGKIASSKRPSLWLLVSLVTRTSVTLAGFYLAAGDHGEGLIVCLLGFVLARVIIIRLVHAAPVSPVATQEAGHAS